MMCWGTRYLLQWTNGNSVQFNAWYSLSSLYCVCYRPTAYRGEITKKHWKGAEACECINELTDDLFFFFLHLYWCNRSRGLSMQSMRKRLCTSFTAPYSALVLPLVRTAGSPHSSASANASLFSCHLLPLLLITQVICFSFHIYYIICRMN